MTTATPATVKFKRDTNFRKGLFTPDSFAHPAKMDAQLLIWIVERFTSPGETILDPMFGSGTTMLACIVGRNVIGVELEQKFVDMAKANWEKVRQKPQLGYSMGTCQIFQGDARNLEGLLVDKIVTSPPFPSQKTGGKQGAGSYSGTDLSQGLNRVKDDYIQSENPDNLGNLPYGEVDKCIFSPPYAEAHDKSNLGVGDNDRADLRAYSYLKEGENNISNLPYGSMDSVITSPPYEGSLQGETNNGLRDAERLEELTKQNPNRKWKRRTELTPGRMRAWGTMGRGYTDRVDAVITSPPYEASVTGQSGIDPKQMTRGKEGNWKPRDRSKEPAWDNSIFHPGNFQYSPNSDNMGNLKSTSYLEAMAQVYSKCYKVLKPGGLMILVTKNFIREQKEIRLDSDTVKLCEQVGFRFQERWYRELTTQSFWRVIYRKKYPDAPELKDEDVLVLRKDGNSNKGTDNTPAEP